ncbi:MAG: hypothetical protein ACJAUD_000204 [Crocinitomicaceae bacterium]
MFVILNTTQIHNQLSNQYKQIKHTQMKSLTLLIFAVGCTTAFGQAMSTASNTNGLRDYATNAVPIGYMADSKTGGLNAQSVAQDFERFSKQSDNPDTRDLSMADIQAILENRLAVTDRASSETIEVTNKQ